MLLPTGAALWGSGWGCGGIVTDSGFGKDGGAGQRGSGGGRPGTGKTCGNGSLETGEQCDGTLFLGSANTCAAATAGAKPNGILKCTASCVLDMTGCSGPVGSGGYYPGTGGKQPPPPIGGYFGGGGQGAVGGTFGFPSSPANDCFAKGGVPDPSGSSCSFGVDATNACLNYIGNPSCSDKCGCSQCPDAYDHCKNDFACAWIFSCAQVNSCLSLWQCEASGCQGLINSSGGPSSASATLAGEVLDCFANGSCPLSCSTLGR